MFNQRDYFISERKLEFSKICSILKYLKDNYSEKSPLSLELINKTFNELEENNGENVTPQTFNCIILMLISFVPDNIKYY